MKHLLLLCLLTFCSPAFGQSADFTTLYYPHINAAEMAITRDDFPAAISHYKKAFSSVKNGFARDYRNAILCGIQAEDAPFVFGLMEKIALKGVDKKYFEDSVFVSLQGKREWSNLMKSLDRLNKKFLATSNPALIQELEAMHKRDQFFREKEGSYEVYGDTIAKIDFENVLRFQEIVKENGFPTEEEIGAFRHESAAPYYIVLHHQAQRLSQNDKKYRRAPSLSPEIIEAAKGGKCSPAIAGYLLSLENNPSLNYGAWGINRLNVNGVLKPYFLLDKHPEEKLKEIDQKRASIGLESLAEFQAKCQYWLDHPNTPFVLSCQTNVNIWHIDEASVAGFESYSLKLEPSKK